MVLHAKPSYYPNRGTLSLQAREIRMVGLGELLARLERRRQLLAAEGLFAAELKRPLPFLPGRVGLVTAPNSAAERDVLENARRRWPAVSFEVAYAAMQGQRSAAEVIEALERLDRDPTVEVIVIARGGGSVEDLLPFSDEALIRAVHRARTPVVSAIGHEPDTPLLDLVADVRASTPTDAAKLVVPDVLDEQRQVLGARDRVRAALAGWLAREQAGLDRPALPARARRPAQPARRPRRRGGAPARSGAPDPGPPARPSRRRHRPSTRSSPRPLTARNAAAGLRRAAGRRGSRRHLGLRSRRRSRRQRARRRRSCARHHHPHRTRPHRSPRCTEESHD